jgi:hypothetical protein
MDAYGTNLAQSFAAAPLKVFYARSVADQFVNRDYEGQIKGKGTVVNVMTLAAVSWRTYTGADMTPDDLQEVAAKLVTDQQRSYYFRVRDIDQLKSWIKNPQGTVIERLGNDLKKEIDTYVLSKYDDVAAGNRVGTDYTTGTVAVAATTGVVTGTGTTFTASMVGRGFKAAGHTKWYRVKTYTSATSITIEDDYDDVTSAYTGGAISAGATYTIEAATPLTLTVANIDSYIIKLREKLTNSEVPTENRNIAIPAEVYSLLLQANILTPYTASAYEDVVKRGIVGMARGFVVYEVPSGRLAGDNTNGFHIIAANTAWQTFAEALTEAEEEPFLHGNFGKGFKGLVVYGSKVADERRKFAAELFAKV